MSWKELQPGEERTKGGLVAVYNRTLIRGSESNLGGTQWKDKSQCTSAGAWEFLTGCQEKKINGGIDQTPVTRRLRKSVARGIRDPGHGPEQSDL